ncbi:MAG: efflux RND transporter periplasmic adaptor subunit [Archangium sp.]
MTGLVLLGGGALWQRSLARENKVALAQSPKGVTVVAPHATTWRPKVRYVGTFLPLLEARLGPQLTSAMVDTVLVRPGQRVKRGQLLATLDCRSASASSAAVAAQARALQARQQALERETERTSELIDGGYVSLNEVDQRLASVEAAASQLAALTAQQQGKSLEVDDCLLKAPFAGEISERLADPGTFVRPGSVVLTMVDRSVLRLAFEVPEVEFASVRVGTPLDVRVLSTGARLSIDATRVSPAADRATRSIHVEAEWPNDGTLPAGTTAEVFVEVGEPQAVSRVPLVAARVKGSTATLFVIEGGRAYEKQFKVAGEESANLFLAEQLGADVRVVTQGRSQLRPYDAVDARLDDEGAARGAAP